MKQIILDTSFIVSAVRNKLDFFEQLEFQGFKIIIPDEVIGEIKGLAKSKPEAELALKILEKSEFKEIELGMKNVDNGLVKFAKENSGVVIATLDKEIRQKLKGRTMIIRGIKNLEIV